MNCYKVQGSAFRGSRFFRLWRHRKGPGSKFIAIDDHALFAVAAQLAGDHLHRQADLHAIGIDVGQLGGQ